jgi:uncharacterized cupin superfamily protein
MAPSKFNLFGDDWDPDRERDDPGYKWQAATVGERIGGEKIGASLYELAAGQKSFPYHYEYGNEEWLICIAGQPTLRTPDGDQELEPGDTVCFKEGPEGAHQVINRTDQPARVLILSTQREPSVAVYPDSDKIGIWPGLGNDDRLMAPRSANVDYYHGEDTAPT